MLMEMGPLLEACDKSLCVKEDFCYLQLSFTCCINGENSRMLVLGVFKSFSIALYE